MLTYRYVFKKKKKEKKKNVQKRLWEKDLKNLDDNDLILDQKFQLSLFGFLVLCPMI